MDKLERELPRIAGENDAPVSQLPLWTLEREAARVSPSSEQDPPWSLADLFAFILFAIVSFLVANLVSIGVFFLLRRQLAWDIPLEDVLTRTPFVVSMQTGWELLWLLFIYAIVTVKYRRPFWEALKWRPGPHPWIVYVLGGVVLAMGAQVLFRLFPSEKRLPIEGLFYSPESAYLLAAFGICVAPFVEELVFRGFFYPVFERLWGLMAAVLLSALLFAFVHMPQLSGGWQEIGAIFVLGTVFSYFRGKTGSLRASFLMHLGYNISLFLSLYFSTDRFQTLGG